jgi:hypothetical protein
MDLEMLQPEGEFIADLEFGTLASDVRMILLKS